LISVIIPAYNESEHIEETVSAVKKLKDINEVIVVDDGSKDKTLEKAKKAGAKVIRHIKNLGKGHALTTGVRAAKGEILVFLDADVGSSAGEVSKLIEPIKRGEADMTVAQFPFSRKKGGFGLVKNLASFGIYIFTRKRFNAPISGQRALNRKVIAHIDNFAEGFSVEVALTIKAVKGGFSIQEVPVEMKHRETGRNLKDFIHRGKQFWEILNFFIKEINLLKK